MPAGWYLRSIQRAGEAHGIPVYAHPLSEGWELPEKKLGALPYHSVFPFQFLPHLPHSLYPFTDRALTHNLLVKRRQTSISPWIFHDPKDPAHPISPNAAYQKLKDLLRKAELPSIRFHDLRHTFATHALQSGVDAKTLSGILGHTDASFTLDTYTHVTTDMQQNASRIVGGFMEEVLP